MFYYTVDTLPSSWSVTSVNVNVNGKTPFVEMRRLNKVPVSDIQSIKGYTFTHIVMALCNIVIQQKDNDQLVEVIEALSVGAKTLVTLTFDRGMIVESPLSFRYLFGDSKLITHRTTSEEQMFWNYTTSYNIYDIPLDMDEACLFPNNLHFTPDPSVPPRHLSYFIPAMPDSHPWDCPEKLIVSMCFTKYSSFSPVMERVYSERTQEIHSENVTAWNKVARIGESEYYLVNSHTSRESIIHAMLLASSATYGNLTGDKDRESLVAAYKLEVESPSYRYKDKVLQVCKGVHLHSPEAYDVCIFNIVQGGSVTSTTLPRMRGEYYPEISAFSYSECLTR